MDAALNPTISIVMPCFNAVAHLPQSFASVFAQSFTDWELIAVDDGSVDGTLAWLHAQRDPRVRVLHQSNQGVSAARNAGLALAQGRYVAFLDADDTWAPDFLNKLYLALASRPVAVLAYCGWQNLGLPGGRGQPYVPPDHETPEKEVALFTECRWPIHAALVRRDALQKAGGFDRQLKNAEDFLLWLEVATPAPILRVPEVLAFYHFHGGPQASSHRARAALHHLGAQQTYLKRHPDFAARLGRTRRRKICYGGLLATAFECYWQRDLVTARILFRRALTAGYLGQKGELKYMLPAMLPISIHRMLLELRDTQP